MSTTHAHRAGQRAWKEMRRTEDDLVALLPHLRDEGLAWVDHAGEAVDR